MSTYGIEFSQHFTVQDNQITKLKIWEIADHDNWYYEMIKSYYASTAGFLLVYDITRRETFDKLTEYLDLIRGIGPSDVTIMLVGNKNDVLGQSR